MAVITFDLGPPQKEITEELIEEMITWVPRRFRLCDFDKPLKPPGKLGDWQEDWNLIFPFQETLVPTFQHMCPSVEHISFRLTSTGTAFYTFLKNVSDSDIQAVQDWIKRIERYVALRDRMAISFAIDYDRVEGNPENQRTNVGRLRKKAKTYGKRATQETHKAADELIELCLQTLGHLTCYDSTTCVVGVPPSDPEKPFDLPEHLASGISSSLGKSDKTEAVRTTTARPGTKGIQLENKLSTIRGTIEVDRSAFKDEVVLLVDDLYQSGVTMNYVGMLLLEAGAKKIFGLSCEKTCSNDDNVSRRQG
ncbi:MAG: hypothetical protein SWE60_02200 [Thermodesulfobacteriota bacterium]|nr:hypothetical protein [Thermodesulfobacteriota bacterium]